MIRTVVASVTDVVTVSVSLISVRSVRAVVEMVESSVAVTVDSGRFAYVTLCSCRIVIQLVGVRMIGAVVAYVTDVVTIFVFLKRIVFVRAVVLVIEFPVLVAVKNDRFADITLRSCRIAIKLIGVGVIGAVVAYVTDVVTIFVFLKRIVFVRAVVLVIEFPVLVAVKNDRFADITFRSCRIVVQLIGVGVIGAVVADVTDMVAVFVFLKRVVFVRAVVLVIEFSVLIAVKNDRFADITFRSGRIVIQLICVGVIGAVVAYVTDVVTIGIFLKRVVFVRAVILVVEFSVAVAVYNGKFTDVSDAVVVIIFLISVGVVRAVVASITDTVTVAVQLISVGFVRTVVKIVLNSVFVFVDRCGSACDWILVSVRVSRAAVTSIADTVTVGIFLIGVVIVRTVVLEVFKSVTVGIDRCGSANYGVLVVVGVERAVVT